MVLRIMFDTNVLISLLIFQSTKMNRMAEYIFSEHILVLSSYVVEELKTVVQKKFPGKQRVLDKLLSQMSYEFVYTPDVLEEGMFEIRDIKDYPVLYTAALEEVDILITGDKDFESVEIDKPEIMTPAQFIEKYCS